MIEIQLNGEPYRLPEGATVADLLAAWDVSPGRVAVEVNLAVVPRERFASRVLEPGDLVEVVRFVGGG